MNSRSRHDDQVAANGPQPSPLGRKLLAKNVVWNFAGQAIPLVAGVVLVPMLLHALGVERLGVLGLAWLVIGYFSVFDLGLGRAVTKMVAGETASENRQAIPGLTGTALAIMVALGVVGTTVLWLLTPMIVHSWLKVSPHLQGETVAAFHVLALSIPAVTLSAGLRGILEAVQRFRDVAVLRGLLGLFTYLGPVATLPLGPSLVHAVAAIVVARFAICGLSALYCLHAIPELSAARFVRTHVRPLMAYGSWLTVANVLGPVMVNMDRFMIGALLSVTAVTYYAIPFDLVTRLWLIPSALMGVMFPAFASALAVDKPHARALYMASNMVVLGVMAVPIGLIAALAHPGLSLWLGADFAARSANVLQILAFGVLANSLAQVPLAAIQAGGRPDITTKLTVIELPFYVVLLVLVLRRYGIVGAAFVWTLRTTIDMLLLLFLAQRFFLDRQPLQTVSVSGPFQQ